MLKLVFQIELFVTNNCPSEWHEGTRTSPSSWKRNLIWRWRSSQNNMLGKPVSSGLWTGSRIFPTQKKNLWSTLCGKLCCWRPSHPKSPKIEVRDALLDLGFDPTKATKGCLCSCLKVLGFPNYLCVCMVNDIHWMKEIDGTHFLMHRFTG